MKTILLVTSRFETVAVRSTEEREVIRLDNITRRPGEVKIKEENKIPETMIHKDLTDFLLNIRVLQKWKDEDQESVKMWENSMRWTPGLRKSLGIFEQIPTWTVFLGSLKCSVHVPVRERKSLCYGCNAPLGLYRLSRVNPYDDTQWRLSWMTERGVLESEDIQPIRGYCPACLLRQDWNRRVMKEIGHMDRTTKRSLQKYEQERQKLFMDMQTKALRKRNEESAMRWKELVQKSREDTSTRERELES